MTEIPQPNLAFTPEVKRATAPIFRRLKKIIPDIEWAVHAPLIAKINELKQQRNATILAHNYQTPEIFHGVADIVGDSLALARQAVKTEADVIVLCGVHFMAETAKILNPQKTVLIPDLAAGCSLAESITPQDVQLLKQRYPGTPVVTYVNTSAAVKAECDICCTSSNAVEVVASLESDRVIFLPDEFLGLHVAEQTESELILWHGHCEVHKLFTGEDLQSYRQQYPDITILAHPECSPSVLKEADFVGSTSGMIDHVGEQQPDRIVMITECSMSDNVAVEFPSIEFIRPCNLCPHMKTITLPKILNSLQESVYQVEVDPEISKRARLSLERMLAVG
ncbi:MAG: quinolinate synthase NadA [Acidobacteriota bacterium]|nr:quinolinate synthase NadA [Acidobacteriota bacterium]